MTCREYSWTAAVGSTSSSPEHSMTCSSRTPRSRPQGQPSTGSYQEKQSTPLGRISLEVVFGNATNFRKETLDFEVVDWKSQYHAILGRPAFARFMAVPHYAYLKLKMPGPHGVITISGRFARSDRCDKEFHKISEAFGV